MIKQKEFRFSLTAIIFLVALGIRFFFLHEIIGHPLFVPLSTGLDPSLYNNLAHHLLSGSYNGGIFLILYPLILSVIYSIFPGTILAAKIIQILVGSLSCVLIFKITKRLFNKRAAIIASFISIVYPVVIIHEAILIYLPYVIFLNLCTIYLLLSKNLNFKNLISGGILGGLAFLMSPKNIFFLIFIPFWIYKKIKNHKLCLIFVLGVLISITPFLVSSLFTNSPFHTFPYAVASFYIGNNLHATGVFTPIPKVRYSIKGQLQDLEILAEKHAKKELTPLQVSAYWVKKSIRFIKNNPIKYIKLESKKIMLFFNVKEYPDLIQNLDYFKNYSNLIKFLSFLSFGIVGPLGLLGLILAYRENFNSSLFILYILNYLLIAMMFYVTSRYRLPAVVAFFPFVGFFLKWFYDKLISKKWSISIIATLGVILAAGFVNWDVKGIKLKNSSYYNKGVLYVSQGKLDKAKEAYKKALEKSPNDINAHFGLGEIYFKKGKFEKAIKKFKYVLTLNPKFLDAYYNLGFIFIKKEKINLAIDYLSKLLELESNDAGAHFLLGKAYLYKNNCKKAKEEFRKAISLQPVFKKEVKKLKKSNCPNIILKN